MNMKLINKLNEDFFDDNEPIDNLIDEPVDNLIDEPEYTYNVHFIIFITPFINNPFIKHNHNDEYVYYFEEPKYKPIIESGLLSMKRTLDYILNATPIVTDYSKPKFCSSYEKIIEEFPFMNNKQSNEFKVMFTDKHFITLKTSINLSRRKNTQNIIF